MRRLTEAWFEFKGVRSDSMSVRLMAMPERPKAARKGRKISVPGRDGDLWQGENDAREGISIRVECTTKDGYSAAEINKWLDGEGILRFSDEPNRAYRAQINEEWRRKNRFLSFDEQVFTVVFDCEPHRYIYPEPIDVIAENGGIIENPGTAYSLPRITIAGEGDMSVMIAGQRIDVLAGSVIIDSELAICYESDGNYINPVDYRVIMDDFPRIPPGISTVTWTGNVSSVTVEGRWRYL